MKLFEYQAEHVNDIHKACRKHKRIVAQLATGGGKGREIAEVAFRAIQKGTTVAIAAHRAEIFYSIVSNLQDLGVFPSLICQGSNPMPGAQCYVIMVETFKRRMNKEFMERYNIKLFLCDEIHIGNYYKLINSLDRNHYVIGWSATPKTTGKPELNEYMDTIVTSISEAELIRIGRLVRQKTYAVDHDFSHIRKKGRDFDERQLALEFSKPKLRKGAVENYVKYAKGLPGLHFSVTVERSNECMLQYRDHGIRAVHMDGNTSKDDRKEMFDMHKSGEIDMICNVGIATTGTDMPWVRAIVKDYASLFLVKDKQVNGRGARCFGDKDHFVVIDMGNNFMRHGELTTDPSDFVDWVEIFNKPSAATKEEKKHSKRICEDCGAVMKFTLNNCPYCGSFTPQKELEDLIMESATLKEIRDYKFRTLPITLRKSTKEMDYQELKAYAMHMNYSPRWVGIQMNLRKKYQR